MKFLKATNSSLHVFGWYLEREAAVSEEVARQRPAVRGVVEGLREVHREPGCMREEPLDRVPVGRAFVYVAPGKHPAGRVCSLAVCCRRARFGMPGLLFVPLERHGL